MTVHTQMPTPTRARRRVSARLAAVIVPVLAHACVGALASGCAAERTLVFTSEPSGASVRLDDEMVGVTPCEVDFLHYGTRRVTYYLAGSRTRTFLVDVRAPWYGRFPIDIVSEVLLPIGWVDRKRIHAELVSGLERADQPTQRSVLDRAEALRRAGPNGPRNLPPVEVVTPPQSVDPATAPNESPSTNPPGSASAADAGTPLPP
jgi:hypothetical protein